MEVITYNPIDLWLLGPPRNAGNLLWGNVALGGQLFNFL